MRAQRYIGVDWGEKRVGLAKADDELLMSLPHRVFEFGEDREEDMEYLAMLIKSDADVVVVGLPLSTDGTEGPTARKVREFAEDLQHRMDLPVHFQDERMSTRANEGLLQGMPREEQLQLLDALAAAGILQTWLDRTRKKPAKGVDGGIK
jgi:putative Holliday junction resolvase